MRRFTWAVCLAFGCRSDPTTAVASASASVTAAPSVAPPSDPAQIAVLARAELTRNADAVPPEAVVSRDVAVRTAAARALARSVSAGALDRLLPLLSDEAEPVLRWVAFGLGTGCAGREPEVTRALTLRAATLLSTETVSPDVLSAFAEALARCPSDEAERTLRAWLSLPSAQAESAALALGKLGARRGRLEDGSLVALLDAATRRDAPLAQALYAFTRLPLPAGVLADRVLEVAKVTVQRSGDARAFAVRVLGRAGEAAAPVLGASFGATGIEPAARAEIARELGRLGKAGQRELGAALAAWLPASDAELSARVVTADFGVLVAFLEALTDASSARAALERLSRLPLDGAAPLARQRAIFVRCAAAELVADRDSTSAELSACDPDPAGRDGKLALLAVLGRGKLTRAAGRRYHELARDADPVVRQSALRLIESHRELDRVPELLARALGDPAPGAAAAAAEILAQHPERADAGGATGKRAENAALRPDARVIDALTRALRGASATSSVELRAALIDAAGALGLLGLKTDLSAACESDNQSLREHAERALRALGERDRRCPPRASTALPAELSRLVRGPTRLAFETDAGELALELDPESAPVAVTRLVELARSGFFDGIVVHRFVPGFVAQLGDPGGDGYGGSARPPLASELAPTVFETLAVGLAESGRDTGNSQFFVALARYPHLDGEYPKLGKALPGWERIGAFDRVRKVRVTP